MDIKEAIEQLNELRKYYNEYEYGENVSALRLAIETLEKVNDGRLQEAVRCENCKYADDCEKQVIHEWRDHILEANVRDYKRLEFCSYGVRQPPKKEG